MGFVEAVHKNSVRCEEIGRRIDNQHVRRVAIWAVERQLSRGADELGAASLAAANLLEQRLTVAAARGHGQNEVVSWCCEGVRAHALVAAAVFAEKETPIWCENHAAAATRAGEALCTLILQGAGGQRGVRIDDLAGFQPAVEHGQSPPGAGVV